MSSQLTPPTATDRHTHSTAPTRFAEVDGVRFAYRRFGNPTGTPIVLLQHFMGNFDNYDPAITDALAAGREVILTDNAGVGLSAGSAPETVAGMAADAASLIGALGLEHVDLFGFSMGGFVAQQIAVDRPELVRRLILVGTGPRGGRRRVGSGRARQLRLPQGDLSSGARRQWQQRRRRRHHQLLHPPAEPAERRADPLPGLQPRIALSVHGGLQPLHRRLRRSVGPPAAWASSNRRASWAMARPGLEPGTPRFQS
jgi:pimeloyl-ACP methyl ester carboxylesterase